ncbi:arylsulfotransferase family protein [Lutimonas saemankumensis]|uniref:arylsulfotransferase family protein n=1 Tax=Lutimonas saemankumensis TaxID=483016 RepID=UPI001CD37158|nr:arylsulfotransferase family protein [Lutimonas saemankumensis]MCA0931075.1 arylsulfotransferase family protein [Lutimonas saemankumensis]
MDRIIRILRVLLLLILFFIGISYFSIKGFEKQYHNRNILEKTAVKANELPRLMKSWYISTFVRPEQAIEIDKREDLRQIGKFSDNSKVSDSLFFLFYKYLGDKSGKVYLQNIKNGEIKYSWDIPMELIMNDLINIDNEIQNKFYNGSFPLNFTKKVKKNYASIDATQPTIVDDFSLLFNCGSLGYLYKIDKNSNLVWKSDRLVHHSIELDDDGNIWTCSLDFENESANYFKYREDAILHLSRDGKELKFIPLTEMFKKSGLFKSLIGSSPNYDNDKYGLDPYHLNNVLPAKSNSKYWKKGDVFLSLRTQSMVLNYRPETDSIIWYKQGPWFGQHDINIENDSLISVFNNNVWFFGESFYEPESTSNIMYYDFTLNKSYTAYDKDFKSPYEGRQTRIEGGGLLVEETGKGRYYIYDENKNLIEKFYIPYFSNEDWAMQPNWGNVYLFKEEKFILQ